MGKHHLYINEQGLPEAIDVDTGEVIAMAVRREDLHKYRMAVIDGKRVWVPLTEIAAPKRYSPLMADIVAEKILAGNGIEKAIEAIGLTYREYCLWRKMYPEFAEMIDTAREDRAELFYEKLEAVAEETGSDEEEVGLGRLKADIYKHLSEVSNPGKFGKKTQINAKIGVGVISIETGIRRKGDDGFEEAKLFAQIEAGQKVIEAADLNIVPVSVPSNLPKKVEEI